jgi:hypothetical protein
MDNRRKNKERFFSVELNSKADLRNVTLANRSRDSVLVEGTIGELVRATFAENIILEIVGKKGTLRIDLQEKELRKKSRSATTAENLNGAAEQHDGRESSEVKQCK